MKRFLKIAAICVVVLVAVFGGLFWYLFGDCRRRTPDWCWGQGRNRCTTDFRPCSSWMQAMDQWR